MDLYLLFGMRLDEMSQDKRNDFRKRLNTLFDSFDAGRRRCCNSDVAYRLKGGVCAGADQGELDAAKGTRYCTFPMSAIESFFFNVQDQLSCSDECTPVPVSEPPQYNGICYHCGAPSLILHDSNTCSRNCRGEN